MLKRYSCIIILLILFYSCHNSFHQLNASVKQQKKNIKKYINAEDSRDSVALKNLLADSISTYWKIENPSKEKIISFYKDYWTKNKFSKNSIKSITPIAKNSYSVKTFFVV